jgi:hypothetical protein
MLTRLSSRHWEAPQNTSPLKDPPLYNNQPPSRVHTQINKKFERIHIETDEHHFRL